MSKLLENILRNRQQQTLNEFDMTKSGKAMMRHLGTGYPEGEEDLPIDPEPFSWCQINTGEKNSLQKVYSFESIRFLSYFINELINLSEEMYHHPEITIDHTKVTVTLYTRDINDVTDRDLEMSKKIDEIIEDINVIRFRA